MPRRSHVRSAGDLLRSLLSFRAGVAKSSATIVMLAVSGTAIVEGLTTSTSLGSHAASGGSKIAATGLTSTTSLGEEGQSGGAKVSVTGFTQTTALASVVVKAGGKAVASSLTVATTLGSVAAKAGSKAVVTGVTSITSLDEEIPRGGARVSPLGVTSSTALASVSVWGAANVSPLGLPVATALASVQAGGAAVAPTTGLSSAGTLGESVAVAHPLHLVYGGRSLSPRRTAFREQAEEKLSATVRAKRLPLVRASLGLVEARGEAIARTTFVVSHVTMGQVSAFGIQNLTDDDLLLILEAA